MAAIGPPVGESPHVVVQDAERALGDRVTVVIAPSPDYLGQRHNHLGRRPLSVLPQKSRERTAVRTDFFFLRLDQQLAVGKAPDVEAEEVEPFIDMDDAGLGYAQLQPSTAWKG